MYTFFSGLRFLASILNITRATRFVPNLHFYVRLAKPFAGNRWVALFAVFAFSCATKPDHQKASLVIYNANVYTIDSMKPKAEAIVVDGDRIVYVGSTDSAKAWIGDSTKAIDAGGKLVTPGWIEGHGHIHGMGASLINLNLMKAKNWDEIVAMVAEAVKKAKPGDWIIGRGWHQEKWVPAPAKNHLGYPYHEELDKVSPANPVLLTHASGHSSYLNGMALQLAGITEKTPNPTGGDIVKDPQGKIVGVLEERAQGLVYAPYTQWLEQRPEAERKAEWAKSIYLAEQECLRNGITSFVDAGSSFEQVAWMKELADQGKMGIRHYVMVRSGIDALQKNASVFPIQDAGNHHLTVRSIKVSLDGALGSYGAWLLEPYTDRKGFYGQNTFSIPELKQIAAFAWQKELQLCVHAIGDRANRETIDIFAEQIKQDKSKDHRWRIEHAQHMNPADIPRFKDWSIIASMQGIHCTSDAPFVPKRLGDKRAAEGAYMWRAFMNAGVLVNNGTDVPVEDIDPFANFYASVTRKGKDGTAFYPDQKMTREEALYSYTLANAIAAFEDKDKGSITPGKLADIVIFSQDLMTVPEEKIAETTVAMTMVGGKVVYEK
ncbi:MAG: amidohydrolase [Chitinophagaceae bacterium]|nr:amidohydrolase [Chitinophagaceae bacterium]